MKQFEYPKSRSARKAFNAARRKRETWMPKLQFAMALRARNRLMLGF